MFLRNGMLLTLTLLGFAALHSLTAGFGLKEQLKKYLGNRFVEGWYRLTYNLLSIVTFLPTLTLITMLPDQVIYTISRPWVLIVRGVQLIGLIGLARTMFVTDVLRFAGIKQVVAYLTNQSLPLSAEPLQENGMYGIVRHPLYFFCLIAIWPMPIMTFNTLVFNTGVTLYFVIGSLIEERRLEQTYGKVYRAYRRRVSRLIPWPRRQQSLIP